MRNDDVFGNGLPMFLSVADAAKMLGVSYSYLYRSIHSNDLPAYKFGAHWKIRKQDLLAFIEAQKK